MLWIRVFVAFYSFVTLTHSQSFDYERARVSVAELKGLWRVHHGDDPRWADPSFNDSNWPLIRSDRTWLDRKSAVYDGLSWYRFEVKIPTSHPDLALLVPALQDSYQVFVNGQLVGQLGGMPPQPTFVVAYDQVFPISNTVLRPGKPNVFALRTWIGPRTLYLYARLTVNQDFPLLGDVQSINAIRTSRQRNEIWNEESDALLIFALVIATLLGFSLYFAGPREPEYLWFGVAQAFWSLDAIVLLQFHISTLNYTPANLFWRSAFQIANLSQLEFFVVLLKQERRLAYRIGMATVFAVILEQIALSFGLIGAAQTQALDPLLTLIYGLAVVALLFQNARKSDREAIVLIVPFGLFAAWDAMDYAVFDFGLINVHPVARTYYHWLVLSYWPFPIVTPILLLFLILCAISVVLVLRFSRSRADQERLKSEVEAARVVQQVLIPDQMQTIPGLTIESVYWPAGQVGGDFFQVIPLSPGGVLIVIGDVSGKGMPAAMTVSLVVGSLRSLVQATHSPSVILANLNEQLLVRSQGGFTTCLVLRLDPDGLLTLSNAGHLPPYLDGKELEIETGLPLGLMDGHQYPEQTIRLRAESRLTLITDGVVEAKRNRGELFGFDRAADMSTRSAGELASAAQSFGQHDDITVLCINGIPCAVEATTLAAVQSCAMRQAGVAAI